MKEILLEALQQIATGEIVGESKNYKDSLYIVRQIAKEAIEDYTSKIIPQEEHKQETRVFGTKEDKSFWSDKPTQKRHPEYKETLEEAAKQSDKSKCANALQAENCIRNCGHGKEPKEETLEGVVLSNGYNKQGYGYRKIMGNNTHWITLFISGGFQMYAYYTDDEEMEKIYDTGVVEKITPKELEVLISVLVID
jgi:hypothetical protein